MGFGAGGPQRTDWWTRNEDSAKAMLKEKADKSKHKKRNGFEEKIGNALLWATGVIVLVYILYALLLQ